ncbi:MAG: succinate dehydrogenase, hydrophobic membrane anchor protein [Thiobacillus sp.]|nr:succinate dehydrogenase, hydrophobic membrane anchor protein [Gammaproteobacteria bacterium]MBU4499137.1 succinate dehydrogenase, hydrophobic membrane anchor protein [Gammaproteobacteria bacterium]MDO9007644.1 succinate dehydrogenase, hydrophobic membrane anchor protein [Thiobacillus sp.]MDP1923525.1 succinate dehydrogenase, hydrophobic membrane anchor protein [Thiobacillus sp.]MDP3126708.1 succinate dehydrogenase, hydrophobic membrane anchor protein [Thiobacillus sp.]
MKPVLGARGGTGSWLLQRGTALGMALAVPLFIGALVLHAPFDFASWRAFVSLVPVRLALLLAGMALALHAWVGMRDIFMDYVHPVMLRLLLMGLVILVLLASVLWLATIVWGVA